MVSRWKWCGWERPDIMAICCLPDEHFGQHELVGMESEEGKYILRQLRLDYLLEGRIR